MLIVVAGAGSGAVVMLPFLHREVDDKKTILPQPEPLAVLPKPDIVKQLTPTKKNLPASDMKTPTIKPLEKKDEPDTKQEAVPVVAKPPQPEIKKKVDEPKAIAKIEPRIDGKKSLVAKVVILGETIRLKDPDGEYTVATLNNGDKAVLVGTIKTLKIAGLNEKSELDASLLEAEEIIFTGNINGGSKVTLGKTQKLTILDVNGPQTQITVTLTRDGTLKFRRLNGGVRLQYAKAERTDPPLRIERGEVAPQAEFRELTPPQR